MKESHLIMKQLDASKSYIEDIKKKRREAEDEKEI